METYYERLGLAPGASQLEIKKAYFKLIRKHSPESDPQQFQLIREAYEQLKRMAEGDTEPQFAVNPDPAAAVFAEQIERYRRLGDREAFRKTCEEAFCLFPEDRRFAYLLIQALRGCGKTGKAVKHAEALAKKEPENKWFVRELAFACDERGFSKKSFQACARAYELGCRDIPFMLMYSLECNSNKEFDRGVGILMELLCQKYKWNREGISKLVEIYVGLMSMESHIRDTQYQVILEHLTADLERYGIYLAEYVMELATMTLHMCSMRRYRGEEYFRYIQVFLRLKEICREDAGEEFLDLAMAEIGFQQISNDDRLSEVFQYAYETYIYSREEDETIRKFSVIDVQLCMLAEREKVVSQADIIRREYPYLYEKVKDFFKRLEEGKNLVYLKDSLFKTYCQMEPYISGGYYFEKYPEEKIRAKGRVLHSADSEYSYTRSSKKIGRNDPCPCGSGKKYKHCCMKKR